MTYQRFLTLTLALSFLFNVTACAMSTDHYHQAIQNGEKLCQ